MKQMIIGSGDMVVLDIRHNMGHRVFLTDNFNHIDVYLDCAFFRSTRDYVYEHRSKKEIDSDRGRVVFPLRTFTGNHLIGLKYIPAVGDATAQVLLRDVPVLKNKMTYIVCDFTKGKPFKFKITKAYIVDGKSGKETPIKIRWELNT